MDVKFSVLDLLEGVTVALIHESIAIEDMTVIYLI